MSGLVDIWTSEIAKLREKGQTLLPSVSISSNPEPSKVVRAENGTLAKSLATFIRGVRVKSTSLAYSEASLSMIVDCFSA